MYSWSGSAFSGFAFSTAGKRFFISLLHFYRRRVAQRAEKVLWCSASVCLCVCPPRRDCRHVALAGWPQTWKPRKPGKPGILRNFSEHGILREFCATSGKIVTNKLFLVRHSKICVKQLLTCYFAGVDVEWPLMKSLLHLLFVAITYGKLSKFIALVKPGKLGIFSPTFWPPWLASASKVMHCIQCSLVRSLFSISDLHFPILHFQSTHHVFKVVGAKWPHFCQKTWILNRHLTNTDTRDVVSVSTSRSRDPLETY